MFDGIGNVPLVVECLSPAGRRPLYLLRVRCLLFKGGGGVGNGCEILKDAAVYVPADFDGSVDSMAIDPRQDRGNTPRQG